MTRQLIDASSRVELRHEVASISGIHESTTGDSLNVSASYEADDEREFANSSERPTTTISTTTTTVATKAEEESPRTVYLVTTSATGAAEGANGKTSGHGKGVSGLGEDGKRRLSRVHFQNDNEGGDNGNGSAALHRRGRSKTRRSSRRSGQTLAYQLRALKQRRTLDALPVPDDCTWADNGGDGAKAECNKGEKEHETVPGASPGNELVPETVLRADSVSQGERRGRAYFRGIGANFSTSAKRKKGRTPSVVRNKEVYSRRGVLVSRAISPSPDRSRMKPRRVHRVKANSSNAKKTTKNVDNEDGN